MPGDPNQGKPLLLFAMDQVQVTPAIPELYLGYDRLA